MLDILSRPEEEGRGLLPLSRGLLPLHVSNLSPLSTLKTEVEACPWGGSPRVSRSWRPSGLRRRWAGWAIGWGRMDMILCDSTAGFQFCS